ncbi:hypothetical protein V6N12_018450 [Hibiscus sabdariffa]|uniref:Uncharacterized protein n=1 Tax=Hibiscus sabdariffa TaxID=183260 RepID=A0ABR2BQD3_9ROSI
MDIIKKQSGADLHRGEGGWVSLAFPTVSHGSDPSVFSYILRSRFKLPFLLFYLFVDARCCWLRNDEALKLISYSRVFVAHCLYLRTDSLFLRCVQREQIRSFSLTLTLYKAQPPLKSPWSFVSFAVKVRVDKANRCPGYGSYFTFMQKSHKCLVRIILPKYEGEAGAVT